MGWEGEGQRGMMDAHLSSGRDGVVRVGGGVGAGEGPDVHDGDDARVARQVGDQGGLVVEAGVVAAEDDAQGQLVHLLDRGRRGVGHMCGVRGAVVGSRGEKKFERRGEQVGDFGSMGCSVGSGELRCELGNEEDGKIDIRRGR